MEGTGSIGERLRAARERAFVGRSEEIAWFESLLDEEGSALVWLHAPGGTGKSSLLARWSATAERRGVAVARVDLEHVEPSPDSVLGGFAVALGLDDSEALALALMTPTRHVLVIDSWERGEAIDGWLREAFVPTLPDDTIVVLSGRREPAGPWSSDAGWRSLVRELKLANLPPEAADELLERAGVDHEHRSRLVALCHGHPLALTLVSELDATALPVQLDEAPDILRVLVSRFLSDLPSQLHRRALELCAHTRSTTEDLLRAVVDEPRGHELFTWLQALPFITASQHGLCVHGLARDAVDAELRWRDPERYRAQHAAVRMAIYERMLASGGAERERIFLDMLYLHRASRLVSAFFDFEGLGSGWAERPAPDDHDAIVSIARDHLGPEHARVVEYWIERQPESFVTLRSALGEPLLFAAHLVLEAFEEQDIRADPAIEALSWPRGGGSALGSASSSRDLAPVQWAARPMVDCGTSDR